MPVLYTDIALDQYADAKCCWIWRTGPDSQGSYSLVDLTGCTARLMVRANPGDANPVVSLTTVANAQGVIVLGGSAGTVAVTFNKAIFTQATPLGPGTKSAWSLMIDHPDGTSTELLGGTLWVLPPNPTH